MNNNQDVPPELQHNLAKRMNATTIVLESSHVPIISCAKEVLEVIREAVMNTIIG